MSPRGLSLADALASIKSTRTKDRDDGLTDLRQVLHHNKASPELAKLKDKTLSPIFEELFRAVSLERSNFIKGAKIRSITESRLTCFAEALHLLASSFVARLRSRTLYPTILHIINALPDDDGALVAPLANLYLKTLAVVLSHTPHVEHLAAEEWHEAAEFCCAALRELASDADAQSGTPESRSFVEQSAVHSSVSRTLSQSQGHQALARNTQAQLLGQCLVHLTSATNAPLLDRASAITEALLLFIEGNNSISVAVEGFRAINNCLNRQKLHSTLYIKSIVPRIIAVIHTLWSRNQSGPKSEMLKTLLIVFPFVEYASSSSRRSSFEHILESLVEALQRDYTCNETRDFKHLRLEDLRLNFSRRMPRHVLPLQNASSELRESTEATEHNWTLLSVLVAYTALFDENYGPARHIEDSDEHSSPGPRKRQKRSSKLTELLRQASQRGGTQRLYAMHVIAFASNSVHLTLDQLRDYMEFLDESTTDADASVSSWALLGLAGCALQSHASAQELAPYWNSIGHTVIRLLSSSSHCRAAAHIAAVLVSKDLLSEQHIPLSVADVTRNASQLLPTTISDAAIAWVLSMLRTLSLRSTGAAVSSFADTATSWFVNKWSPSSFSVWSYASSTRQIVSLLDIEELISVLCCGTPIHDVAPFSNLMDVGRTLLEQHLTSDLLAYILGRSEARELTLHPAATSSTVEVAILLSATARKAMVSKITQFLNDEVKKSIEVWQEFMASNSRSVTLEAFHVIFLLACVADIVASLPIQMSCPRVAALRSETVRLFQFLSVFLTSAEAAQGFVLETLRITWATFPGPRSLSSAVQSSHGGSMSQAALRIVFNALSARNDAALVTQEDEDYDEDFVDAKAESQNESSQPVLESTPRSHSSSTASPASFEVCCLGYVAYLQGLSATHHDQVPLSMPDTFVEYLINLPMNAFMSIRPMLTILEEADCPLSLEDADRLLVHVAETVLPDYSFRFAEAAVGSCLHALRMTMHLWADGANASLAQVADQIYEWLSKRHLSDHKLSPVAQQELAAFLSALLKVDPDFGTPHGKPPLRKVLLSILQDSDISVKFSLSRDIPRLFEMYTLNTHHKILEAILESLPFQMDWLEGIALRLHTFTILAESWSTLLRPCVFRIVETVGNVATASTHARLCLARLARNLNLQSAMELFTIFRATLLVHWMDNGNDVDSFPHAAFGFTDKAAFYEATGRDLVPMLASSADLHEIATELQTTSKELCTRNFPQCLSFALGADIDAAVTGKANSHDNELKLRDILGDQTQLNRLAVDCFPSILADMFTKLDSEDAIRKAFDRRKGYEAASQLYTALQAGDPDGEYLPPNLQPRFKAQVFLMDGIERLCRRASHDVSKIWSPQTVSLIARTVVDGVHPALGAIQARRTLRKLRTLVVLSGRTCYHGYVLDQLLSAIRPLVSDIHCSQEAATLFQHLLTRGAESLKQRIGFVLGTCLAINLESSRLIYAKQDSATQDSSYRAALSKAEEFRQWLVEWSADYESAVASAATTPRHFSTLMNYSRLKMQRGSSSKETPEGRLLQGILHDAQSSRRLLSPSMTQRCFKLVAGKEFQAAESPHEDILDDSEIAFRLAPALWKLCKVDGLCRSLSSWAAKAMGRSFQYLGQIPASIVSESNYGQMKELSVVKTDIVSSFAAILRTLAYLLDDEDAALVSLSENTLRGILLSSTDMDQRDLMQQCLGPHLGQVLFLDAQSRSLVEDPQIAQCRGIEHAFQAWTEQGLSEWLQSLLLAMVQAGPSVRLIRQLIPALRKSSVLSERLFPYILHSLLYFARQDGPPTFSDTVSKGFVSCLGRVTDATIPKTRALINALVYLRTRLIPGEQSKIDRNKWLKVDLQLASEAARSCKMFKTALLFVEADQTIEPEPVGRRSSKGAAKMVPDSLLLSIFRQVDEPDAFHGVAQAPSIDSVIDRLAFEGSDVKELLFRGARADSMLRMRHEHDGQVVGGMVDTLTALNMSSLAAQLSTVGSAPSQSQSESMVKAAIKLQQWDVAVPSAQDGSSSNLFSVLQTINASSGIQQMRDAIGTGADRIYHTLSTGAVAGKALKFGFSTLAALSDLDDAVRISSSNDLTETLSKIERRPQWMVTNPSEDSASILLAREAFFGILSSNKAVQGILSLGPREARLAEVRASLHACRIHRDNGSLQDALSKVAYLSECLGPCIDAGLDVTAAVQLEMSNVLWAQGELVPSIRILKELHREHAAESQDVPVNMPALLATLGSHVSDARLEKPDEVMRNYLTAAVQKLRTAGNERGSDAGIVYHAFASYCHNQLTNSENNEELRRSEEARDKRASEVRELEALLKRGKLDEREKHRVKSERSKAKKWYDIDAKETERLQHNREQFLRQSLDAYLHSLGASDDHDTDVLRFLSLWLEHAANEAANASVHRVAQVPSLKFAPLMNQLASRLQDSDSKFQATMTGLVERICHDHPHHAMYHIYAGSRTTGGNDRTAISRNQAAVKMASRLASAKDTAALWQNLCRANEIYVSLANAKSDAFRAGVRIELRKTSMGKVLEREVPSLQIAPLTMSVTLRADCDYSQVPHVDSFRKDMSIAGGLSAPKIITAIASDGSAHKQLFKAGADDLRQDAIMEQVFEQVSLLLQTQKETRRRRLQIRTYKVVPLDAQSGAIEFVQNTQPLNDYLRAAHPRYHPKDYKWEACRSKIDEVRQAPAAKRVEVYRQVAQGFQPVLRHFFFERFEDPDEWFAKRLAYVRSTAAISILGHALGLGDRHCQNILLDTSTGEMVHIDLGVAFEAGRILAVPEVVPFRLTRDIVDGFGIMGVEGVFRRCSEFTLEALRSSREAIMTLLNVLRFDPLYSWSMSPLRAQRLRDEQEQEQGGNERELKSSFVDDGGEADRALSVVERKLAPGLSVQATVNELIQQATDDRNLALLFCGWAAFA